MGTTADKLAYLQGTKAAIKSAIINKGVAVPDGTTFRAYADKIADIIDVPDLSNPGVADDLRSGKQLVGADGGIITGTLAEVTQATPSISVSSGGLITASATQSGGIVEGGSKSATQQLTTQAAKTVTPGTTNQTAVASGRYTTGVVTVKGDANLVPANIAEGVSIFGVTGTHSGIETCTLTLAKRLPNNAGMAQIEFVNATGETTEIIAGKAGDTFSIPKNAIICYISNFGGSSYAFPSLNPSSAYSTLIYKYESYGNDVAVAWAIRGDVTLSFQY